MSGLLLTQLFQIRRGKKIHRKQKITGGIVAVPRAPGIGLGQRPPAHPVPHAVVPVEDARPHRQSGQLPRGRRAIPRQNHAHLPGLGRSQRIGQRYGVASRRQCIHVDSDGQRPRGIRAKKLRILRRGLVARVQHVEIPQLKLPALHQRRRLLHRPANALPLRRFLRQQHGLQSGVVLRNHRVCHFGDRRRQRIAVQRPQFGLRGATRRTASQRRQQQRQRECDLPGCARQSCAR